MIVFVGFLVLRNGGDPAAFWVHWELILALGLLVGNGIIGALWVARLRHHRTLQNLSRFLNDYRRNPASTPERLQQHLPDCSPDLVQLTQSVEALCASYRQALSDRVVQNAALESLRSLLGRVDLDKGPASGVSFRGNTTSRDMVARFTPNQYWLTATPSLQQFLGHPITDLNGRPVAEVTHPDDQDIVKQAFQTALQTGEAHNISFRVRICHARDGKDTGHSKTLSRQSSAEVRHVQVDMLTRFSELGVPLHVRCYLVDISDRVRAEYELRRRTQELSQTNERLRQINLDLKRLKESYRDLYHHAPVMYFSLDPQGHLVTFNDTVLTTLGYSREELFKQPYTRLLASGGKERFLQDPEAYQKSGEVETQWVKQDGTIIDVWIRSTPLQDEKGVFVRSRSVAQDVTERNRLAQELRRRGDELERANADLMKINDSLDEFTGVVSHDLKEPLRTLESYGHFLLEEYAEQLGDEGAHYLDHMINASRRLSNLIEDLLALAQAGRITHELKAFDLNDTVRTACKDLDSLIQRRDAEVIIEGTLPAILGDSPRITQLLGNLITNAIKYNKSGTPRVLIGERRHAQANGHAAPPIPHRRRTDRDFVTIYVADNGIGIDPAYHDQVFGVFRRLHHGEQYEGTGAGLAIAKKIVEAHGGHIWVESTPGNGATFCFTLPRAATSALELQTPRDHAPARPERRAETALAPSLSTELELAAAAAAGPIVEGPTTAPRAVILLVEDMPEIALIAQKLACRAGYQTYWVPTAEAAWEFLNQTQPDLVLLDINLPGMSGLDLCKMLRGTPHLQGLTIALFSQEDQPEAQAAGRSAGADFVLSKDLLCRTSAWQRKLDEIIAASKVRA
jgi:PAS domain S-box-containing protein